MHVESKKKGLLVLFGQVVFFLLYLITFPFLRPRKKKAVEKILLIDFGFLGDTVISFPAVKSIRKRFPKAQIDIVINPRFQELWKYNEDYDTLIPYDVPWSRYGFLFRLRDVKAYISLVKQLRKNNYDLAVDFRGDMRNLFFLVYGSGAGQRVGLSITGGGFLLTTIVPFPNTHEVENNLAVAEALGGKKESYVLPLGKKEKVFAQKEAKQLGRFYVLCPNAGYASKLWKQERWISLAEQLEGEVMVTGVKGDPLAEEIASKSKAKHYAGKLSILELAALMQHAQAVIGVDTGTMHIAASVDAKSIELMAVTRPERWKAYQNCTVIKKDTMEDIQVEDVIKHT